jgi:hypothetical protein
MIKYAFKTIVSPEAVRNEFTALRDSLNSSDKELMQAFWNLGIDRLDDIKREVSMLQASAATKLIEKRELKLAAKPKVSKPAKEPKAKKEPKPAKEPKAKKVQAKVMFEGREEPEIFTGVDDDGDLSCLIVDGTN